MSDKDKDYPEEFLQALKELEEEGIIWLVEENDNE
jgi:hypothetical protein|tara:strand:+ start:346 stop:450 length:105 start_codon:yes stop_codon:yes gene_type:complete